MIQIQSISLTSKAYRFNILDPYIQINQNCTYTIAQTVSSQLSKLPRNFRFARITGISTDIDKDTVIKPLQV